jgi:hypothetical protein
MRKEDRLLLVRRRRDERISVTRLVGVVGALFVGLVIATSLAMASESKERWFRVGTTHGSVEGYRWSAGAKGLKGESLGKICSELSMVEPPRKDVPYVEGQSSTDCGELSNISSLVETNLSFGSGESEVSVVQVLYPPRVRRVKIVLGSGRRLSLRAHILFTPASVANGVPAFRYVVIPLGAGESCVRRITALDGRGRIASKRNWPPCAS